MDRKWVGTGITLLALTMAGCGGSATLSRAELAKRANAICEHRAAGVRAALAGQKNLRVATERALPALSRGAKDLGALKPPEDLKDKYARFIAEERAQVERIKLALAGKSPRGKEHGSKAGDSIEAHTQLGDALGLTVCVGSGRVMIFA